MQNRLTSFIEANVNTFVGFIGSILVWEFVVKPLYGFQTSFIENFGITCIFTVWSIVRGYYVRRYFNWRQHGQKQS